MGSVIRQCPPSLHENCSYSIGAKSLCSKTVLSQSHLWKPTNCLIHAALCTHFLQVFSAQWPTSNLSRTITWIILVLSKPMMGASLRHTPQQAASPTALNAPACAVYVNNRFNACSCSQLEQQACWHALTMYRRHTFAIYNHHEDLRQDPRRIWNILSQTIVKSGTRANVCSEYRTKCLLDSSDDSENTHVIASHTIRSVMDAKQEAAAAPAPCLASSATAVAVSPTWPGPHAWQPAPTHSVSVIRGYRDQSGPSAHSMYLCTHRI